MENDNGSIFADAFFHCNRQAAVIRICFCTKHLSSEKYNSDKFGWSLKDEMKRIVTLILSSLTNSLQTCRSRRR
ncbi:MAG: hypothetical protein JXA18_15175 [Chitinispirillaceae bacterium]|nr:hypothetical protein [Chitinispirillaceae bacterium]